MGWAVFDEQLTVSTTRPVTGATVGAVGLNGGNESSDEESANHLRLTMVYVFNETIGVDSHLQLHESG